jgi:hypothetical protein
MSIRTTVTLDDDVMERARAFSRKRGIPFRQALNDLVRAGIQAESAPAPAKPFQVKPFHLGVIPGLNYDCVGQLLEYLEGPDQR